MAQILTPLKKSKMTVGEWRFTCLLRDYLNDDYLVWYNVGTNGNARRYPDFLIFNPAYGLWCLEIKDWYLGNVTGMNPKKVVLKADGQEKSLTNPIEQARDCCLPVINHMQKDQRLCHSNGKYQGKLLFPWGFGAVMCNWQRSSRLSAKAGELLQACFPPHLTWYKEDILEGGLDRDGFLAKLHAMLPYRFPVRLDDEQSKRVRAHIYPEFIVGAQGEIFIEEPDHTEIVKIMDNAQEKEARSLGSGHRVIHGVAGSGKTIILQHRVRQLAEAHPQKPILVVCYNILLASLLKARLDDVVNIEVCHFHDWCGQMKTQYDIKIPRSENYADKLAETICAAVIDGRIPGGQYHAVLIDEGHDFAEDWLRALVKMPEGANSKEQQLLLLYDDVQTLYPGRHGINFSLSSVGIQAQGRTRILHTNYRNSEEIYRYADNFIHHFISNTALSAATENALAHDDIDDEESTTMNSEQHIPTVAGTSGGGRSGHEPEFLSFASRNEEAQAIIAKIRTWHDEGTPYGDIAVLCHAKWQGEILAKKLYAAGLPLQNATDGNVRKNYRPDPQRLLVCTIHSSKGSEFPRVIVAGVDTLPDGTANLEQSARILYVGMTRAQERLCLTAAGDNAFTRVLPQTVVDTPRHITGSHALLDCYGCDAALLGDAEGLENILREAAQAAGATILAAHFHHFGAGAGVTGVLLLAESHLSIHTWPEHHFAALDIYLCSGDITRARRTIEAALRPAHSDWRAFPRGCSDKVLP